MKSKMVKVFVLVLTFCLLLTFNTSVFAANLTGYAIYRNGVDSAGTDLWHTGISVNSTGTQIAQASGTGDTTKTVSLADFRYKTTNKIMGYYSKSSTSNAYTSISSTATTMANKKLPYTLLLPMDGADKSGGGYLTSDEVTSMRCDGFVEYCYEYNNEKIMSFSLTTGSVFFPTTNTYWDISSVDGLLSHSFISGLDSTGMAYTLILAPTNMTPKKQAGYLTYVSGKE